MSRADLALVLALLAPAAGRAAPGALVLPATADTSIACHPTERWLNAGGSPHLKLKGNENLILLDFGFTRLAGRRVARATLHLKPDAPDQMLRMIGISTVGAAWSEGAGNGMSTAGDGESSFVAPGTAHGRKWAGESSGFLDVVFGRAGTSWTRTIAGRGADGWLTVEVDPRLVEACAAGLSYGLCLSDDSGQTMRVIREVDPASNMGNNHVFSREQHGGGPWLEVEAGPAAATPPGELTVAVAPWRGGTGPGGVEVSWEDPEGAAADILGYRIALDAGTGKRQPLSRWMIPSVSPVGERVRAHLDVPPGVPVTAVVEVVGRAGMLVAHGLGAGFSSPPLPPIPPSFLVPSPAVPVPSRFDAFPVWAVPEGVKVDPLTGNVLEDAAHTYRSANPAWTGADHTVRLAALRGEWIGFQLILPSAGSPPQAWSIKPGALQLQRSPGARIPADQVHLSRVGYVPDGHAGWVPDPLLPLTAGAPVVVPDPRRPVPGQAVQAVAVEVFVPRDVPAGEYAGKFEVNPPGGPPAYLGVRLAVANAVLPETAHFTWSLNAYNSPGYAYGRPGTPEFVAGERAAYVLAHEYRSTLAILHYSHSGNYDEGCVPGVTGTGSGMRVKDWSAWDERFGPLFDGSAFAGTSRPHAALDHFYTALCEHYPTTMADGYRWNSVRWEDHWKQAGPIEEGFSRAYRDQWVAVARDYLAHIKARRWATSFQVYLNDKYFYKMYDPKRKAWGQGVSFWLLDEPVNADDFLALRFFGRLLRQATGGDHTHLVFRADVSQPEWSRDLLDRVIDVQVSGGFGASRRLLWDWRDRYGQRVWTYGDSPGAGDSDLMLSVTALDLYAHGVDGYVPWLALGAPEDWGTFATTSLLYDGRPAGLSGPCASLRLQAYRRAEQDVEYLRLYAAKNGQDRDDPNRTRLAALLQGVLGTQKRMGKLDAQGAETTAYEGVDPARLESLRRSLAAGL